MIKVSPHSLVLFSLIVALEWAWKLIAMAASTSNAVEMEEVPKQTGGYDYHDGEFMSVKWTYGKSSENLLVTHQCTLSISSQKSLLKGSFQSREEYGNFLHSFVSLSRTQTSVEMRENHNNKKHTLSALTAHLWLYMNVILEHFTHFALKGEVFLNTLSEYQDF